MKEKHYKPEYDRVAKTSDIKEILEPQIEEVKSTPIKAKESKTIFSKQDGMVVDENGDIKGEFVIGLKLTPSLTDKVVDFVRIGTKVEIVGKENGFYKIIGSNISGEKYINQKYLKLGK